MESKPFDSVVNFTRASAGTYLNESGLIVSAANNEPRLEYDADGNPRGLLFEAQRTNLATQSENFANGIWVKNFSTATAGAGIAPDGTNTATKLTEDATTNNHYVVRSMSGSLANTTYTWSVFVKAGERENARVQIGGFAGQVATNIIAINLITGEFTATDNNRTVVVKYPNGWWRVSSTVTVGPSPATMQPSVYILSPGGQTSYPGDGDSGIYIWGGQFELADCPSSYIPAVASTVTRASDLAHVPAGDWLKDGEGTLVAEVSHQLFNLPVSASLGTALAPGNIMLFTRDSDRRAGGRIYRDAGTIAYSVVIASSPVLSAGDIFKHALAYAPSDSQFSTAGIASGVGAPDEIPVIDRLNLGTRASNTVSSHMVGHIRRISYYPRRMSAAELQALTA